VLEVGDDDSIVYANALVAAHVGLAGEALAGHRWSHLLAFRGLRRGIGEARRSGGPTMAATLSHRCGPASALCWTLWTPSRDSGSRAVVAIGSPA
jgi:hypothetical protein